MHSQEAEQGGVPSQSTAKSTQGRFALHLHNLDHRTLEAVVPKERTIDGEDSLGSCESEDETDSWLLWAPHDTLGRQWGDCTVGDD